MDNYSVKKLSKLAGVSVRTLHLYDKISLLKPSVRTEARYRLYGEKELLRLQQILFYRELDFPLKEIASILDDPAFNVEEALEGHKVALLRKKARIDTLVGNIEKTLFTLKNKTMLQAEDLYEGIPKEKVKALRSQAIAKWGNENVSAFETNFRNIGKDKMEELMTELAGIHANMEAMVSEDPGATPVQELIARRYQILLQLTGGEASAFKLEHLRKIGEIYSENSSATAGMIKPGKTAFLIQKATEYYLKNK